MLGLFLFCVIFYEKQNTAASIWWRYRGLLWLTMDERFFSNLLGLWHTEKLKQ